MSSLLKFGKGNAKLGQVIVTFSLPAGYSCPAAKLCKSKAVLNKKTGKRKIVDGKHTKFRCFAATSEVMYTKTFDSRWHNFYKLRGMTTNAISLLILTSLPPKVKIVRIHVSGDFFSQRYFDAWLTVARFCPDTIFYAYTKSLKYWVKRLETIPANFILTASYGGRFDHLIAKHNLRYAKVVFSEEEAQSLGLAIDHDDSHAIKPTGNFALLIHGVQPKGTEAAKAKRALNGLGSYSKKKLKTIVGS